MGQPFKLLNRKKPIGIWDRFSALANMCIGATLMSILSMVG